MNVFFILLFKTSFNNCTLLLANSWSSFVYMMGAALLLLWRVISVLFERNDFIGQTIEIYPWSCILTRLDARLLSFRWFSSNCWCNLIYFIVPMCGSLDRYTVNKVENLNVNFCFALNWTFPLFCGGAILSQHSRIQEIPLGTTWRKAFSP